MDIIANLITNIIDVNLLFYYLIVAFRGEKNKNTSIFFWLSVIVLFNTLVNNFLGLANIAGFILILTSMSFIFKLIFNEEFLSIFIALLIGMIFMFTLELVTANLIIYIFKLTPLLVLELNIYKILAIIISKGSFFLITHCWISKTSFFSYFQYEGSRPIAFIFLFNSIIIYMAFILYRYIKISSYIDYIVFFTLTMCVILFSWLIYIFTKKMVKQEQQEEFMKIKIKEYENQNFYIKNMEDVLQNIRAQRHDFNNHVSTLYGLIYLNKFEEAKKYILGLAEDVSIANKIVDVGHPVLTALINMKRDKILRENIKMNLDAQLPKNLTFEYVDLSIIIGNLLDNAIEACMNPNIDSPFIELVIKVKSDYLVIETLNSKSNAVSIGADFLEDRFTTKEDKENHGFGLKNIKRIVGQYNGLLKIENKENTFAVHIALPLECCKADNDKPPDK